MRKIILFLKLILINFLLIYIFSLYFIRILRAFMIDEVKIIKKVI